MLNPENAPLVSVIIPAHKRPEVVRKAILSVFAQDLEKSSYELILVDASPDESVRDVVEELRPFAPCRFTYLHKNAEGPGPSRNFGVAQSSGAILAFMDSDCAATPGWLRSGLPGFSPGVGIVQGPVQPAPGKSVGVFSHSLSVDCETYCYQTANVFYRRTCFDEAGGFMKNWLPRARRNVGGEDVDLAWRVKRRGWKTFFAAEALVYHDVLPTPAIDWIWIRSMVILPWLVAWYPELRSYFYARYFYDRAQAFLVLGLVGTIGSLLTPWLLTLWLPYAWLRCSEPSNTLRGPLRFFRPAFYWVRDMTSFSALFMSSVRSRTILL